MQAQISSEPPLPASKISRLGSYCAAEEGARAPRPSALDECRTRHPPSAGSSHGSQTRALAASGTGAPDRALQKPLNGAVRLNWAAPQQGQNGMGRAAPHPGVLGHRRFGI